MDFSSLQLLEHVVFNTSSPAMRLHSAAEFYATALRQWINEPEHAYVNMVTAGECLAGLLEHDWDDLADSNSQDIVAALQASQDANRLYFYIAIRLGLSVNSCPRTFNGFAR